jgi:Na+-driven multidrug efflux pump
VLSAGRVLFIFLPLALLGQWLWQIQGLFIATATANLIIGLWAWLWLQRYIRQVQT